MKPTLWLNYLPLILVASCLAPVAVTQAYPLDSSVYMAQARTEYDRYMRLGYAATASRDYTAALVNFRRALGIIPGDRYASNAVRNVSNYVASQGNSRLAFVPPNWGAPGNRQGGATRGGCASGNKSLTALVPATNLGMTTAEYPELYFYIPKTSAQTLELALSDENEREIYKTAVAPNRTPGIVKISFADFKDLPPLKSQKKYHWYVSLICDSSDRSADISVDGWVQRIQPDPMLASELQRSTAKESVSLYAVNGIWYDTVAALAQTRQSSPTSSLLAKDWKDLLTSVGLEGIASEPLVECCTLSRN